MNYKLYIFDMGGVLAENFDVRPDIYKYLKINDKEFLSFAGTDFDKYSAGEIKSEEFWKAFSERYGTEIKEDLFAIFFKPKLNEKTEEIIKNLKKEARVVCGTNTIDPHYNYHYSKGQYDVFDKVYASNKIGISKPASAFYRFILDNENVEPAEAVFIDDMKENVEAASEIGIKSILFRGAEFLIEKLS